MIVDLPETATPAQLVAAYAAELRELLPEAGKARGVQPQAHPARVASDAVNALIVEFVDERKGNLSELQRVLGEAISYVGLRRRLRVARSGIQLGAEGLRKGGGVKDPAELAIHAESIRQAKAVSSEQHKAAVREAYEAGLNLQALARELGVTYYALWVMLRS